MIDRVALIYFACNLLGGAGHYLFNLAMTRMMSKAEMGQMMALLNLVVMTAVPLTAFQNVVTQYVATWMAKGQLGLVRGLWTRMSRDIFILGVCLGGGVLFGAGKIREAYDLPSLLPVVVMATIPLPMVLVPVLRGVLQGAHAFIPLGINLVAEGAGRLGLGVGLVWMAGTLAAGVSGGSMAGGLAATTGAGVLALLLGYAAMRRVGVQPSPEDGELKIGEIYRFAVPVFLAQFALSQMTFMDLPILGARFSGEKGMLGLYAGVELLAKAVFFLPIPFSGVMFSRVAALEARGLSSRSTVLKTLGIVSLLSAGVVAGFALLPNLAMKLTIGEKFLPVAPLLVPFGFAMTGFALTNTLVFYQISRKATAFMIPFMVVTLLQWWAVLRWPTHMFDTVLVLAVFAVIHLAMQIWFALLAREPSRGGGSVVASV